MKGVQLLHVLAYKCNKVHMSAKKSIECSYNRTTTGILSMSTNPSSTCVANPLPPLNSTAACKEIATIMCTSLAIYVKSAKSIE